MRCWTRPLAVVMVLGIGGVVMAEQIDNPEYKEWSKYKAGTYVTIQQSSEMPGMAAMPGMPPGMNMAAMLPVTKETTKLTEVKADSLTLEVTTETTQMGQSNSNKTTRTVAAKIDQPKGTATATAPAGVQATLKDLKEGKETLDVHGKKVDTVTREYTTTVSGLGGMGGPARGRGRGAAPGDETPTTAHVKMWSSDAVPGGLVKSEQTTTTNEMGDVKMTITVVDFDVVK